MSFVNSIQKGLQLATAADAARREIAEILQRLNEDIQSATNGRVTVQLQSLSEKLAIKDGKINLHVLWSPKQYDALIVIPSNLPLSKERELARWVGSQDGYPCALKYTGEHVTCVDGMSLQTALEDLMSTSWAGRIIQAALANSAANLDAAPTDDQDPSSGNE